MTKPKAENVNDALPADAAGDPFDDDFSEAVPEPEPDTNEEVQKERSAPEAPVGVGEIWMADQGAPPAIRFGGTWQVVFPTFWARTS